MVANVSALRQHDRTGLVLMLDLLAFIVGPLTGIPAWLMAHQDIRDIRTGLLDPSLEGRLQLARTISIIGTFVNVVSLFLLFVPAMVLFMLIQVSLEMLYS